MMSLDTFKDWAVGQGSVAKYDDGQYMGECVSLINQYCYRVLGIPAKGWGNAKDWGTNAAPLTYFDRVNDVQKGDVLVYPATSSNPYGHIEVALGGGRSIGQNRYYTGKVGVFNTLPGYSAILRSKTGGNTMTAVVDESIKTQLRIVNSEVKGWNRAEVHSGKFDDREFNAWKGQTVQKFLQQAWDEGAGYRQLKDKWENFYNTYKDVVGGLSARPTRDELQKALGELDGARKAVLAAEAVAATQKSVAEQLAKENAALEAKAKADEDAGKSFLRILGEFVKQFIGKEK